MSGNNDETYDLAGDASDAPRPVLPVEPVGEPSLAYATPDHARPARRSQPEIAIALPSWKIPTLLIAIGAVMVYAPILFAAGSGAHAFLYVSAYLLVRFAMAVAATFVLAYLAGISFGEGGSYVLRLLAVVLMTEGAMFTTGQVIGNCLAIPFALAASLATCWALFAKLFDLETPENLIAAVSYWVPGIAGILLIWKLTSWLVGLVT